MTQNFCEHLEEYGVVFGRAKASYGNCLNLLDKVIVNPEDKELRTTLENSLDEWVLETRNLRQLFVNMKKKGEIELAADSELEENDNSSLPIASCSACSFVIPKLEFKEFDLSNEDKPTYRGQTLPRPAGAGV